MPDTPDSQGHRPDEEPPAGVHPPAWHDQPMPPFPQSAIAPKPGVIPLRPLGVGEILGGAIATIRTRPALMLGMTAVVTTVIHLLTLAATYSLSEELYHLGVDTEASREELMRFVLLTFLVSGIGLVVTVVTRVFLSGFFTVVVGTAVLGERPALGEVLTRLRPRFLPLLGLTVLYIVVVSAAGALVAVLMLTVPALGVLVMLGAIVVAVWLWTLFSLATPALVLEHAGIGQAFGRSRQLVRGSWWRIFGITLLTTVIALVVAFVITLPFESLGGGFPTTAVPPMGTYLVWSSIGAVVASTITEPFVAAVIALVYTDQRMRTERLDVELARTAGATPHG